MTRIKWLFCLILSFFVLQSTTTLLAQTKWMLKGGGMVDSWTVDEWDGSMKKPTWMVELGIETPLNKYDETWMFETGIRYINKYAQIWWDENKHDEMQIDEQCHFATIPLKIGYNLPIGNSQLRFSIGPNFSYLINSDISGNGKNGFRADIEPNLSINYKALQLGVSYGIPVYKGYVNENKNNLMITLGVRFSSKVWSGVGAGLLAVGAVAGGVAAVYSEIEAADGYNSSYERTTTGSEYTQSTEISDDFSSTSLTDTERDEERKQRRAETKEKLKKTKYEASTYSTAFAAYNKGYDNLINMHSSPEKYLSNMSPKQFIKKVKDTQDRLKSILKKYKEGSGKDLPVSTDLLNWKPNVD